MGDYYVWQGDSSSVEEAQVFSDAPWLAGEKLATKPKPLTFKRTRLKPVGLPDVMEIHFGLLLLSPSARSVLDTLGVKNIEYVPVRIKPRRGTQIDTSYCMANIVGRVDCLDRKHADFRTFADSNDTEKYIGVGS